MGQIPTVSRPAGIKSAALLKIVLLALLISGGALFGAPPAHAQTFSVVESEISDLKAVFATVRSKDRTDARVRTPGTIVELKVEEGAHVEAGQVLALVADPKLALQIKSLDAQIVGLESRFATAKRDYERGQQLAQRGVLPKARIDQLQTAFDVANNELKSVRTERLITQQQVSEGQVLAPASGRVLRVPMTEGSVVMAGESIVTIAANDYLLRLELPERHARFISKGDPVKLGARGLATQQVVSEGRIIQVYPELQNGRVLADAAVDALGDYFVGERVMVWITAGTRRAIIIPSDFLFQRFGLDFVSLQAADSMPREITVQRGQWLQGNGVSDGVEILAGLKPGDTLMRPAVSQ